MKTAPQPVTMNNHPHAARVLCWSLRLFGSVDLLATAGVVMPAEWLRTGHALCGLGEFPEGPLPLYLARSASMLYAFHGAVLWSLSMDVRRYRPVIRFIAAGTVLLGTALVFIDLSSGVPLWWTLMEGPVFAATGLWTFVWTSRWNPLEDPH